MQRNYFPDTDRMFKKDFPPVVLLTWTMMNDKKNQTDSASLKRKHALLGKQKLDDTMLGFQAHILPAADGCHPSITLGTQSNKINKFNAYNPLKMLSTGEDDEDCDDDADPDADPDADADDEDYNDKAGSGTSKASSNKAGSRSTKTPYDIGVDDDGTSHFYTADGIKDISYRKNAPQNGKLYQLSYN